MYLQREGGGGERGRERERERGREGGRERTQLESTLYIHVHACISVHECYLKDTHSLSTHIIRVHGLTHTIVTCICKRDEQILSTVAE